MAIDIQHLGTIAYTSGSALQTVNVNLGGTNNYNAIIVFNGGTYDAGTNATVKVDGVTAGTIATISNTNYINATVRGIAGLAPGNHTVTVQHHYVRPWTALIYGVTGTLGWNTSITSYIGATNLQTRYVNPALTAGKLYVEHIRSNTTNDWGYPTPQSGQTILSRIVGPTGSYRHNNSIIYKKDVGTNPSLGLYYDRQLWVYNGGSNGYAGIEFLEAPSGGGGGSVIWW